MVNVALIIGIIFLFVILGVAADSVVKSARSIAHALGVPMVFLGLIIGLLTTLPELSIGLSAIAHNAPNLAVGNLLGGILVLFLLILGLAAILARRIGTDGNAEHLAPVGVFVVLPFILALDGHISTVEGIALMGMYLLLLFLMYEFFAQAHKNHTAIKQSQLMRELLMLLVSLFVIIVTASGIVNITLRLLADVAISPFIIGLLIFPIGTNLPEIIVSVRAWRRHATSLSWSNLVGSAIANVFILGTFAVIKPLSIVVDGSFIFLSLFAILTIVIVTLFYRSGRVFTRREGIALLMLYAMFIFGTTLFLRTTT